MPRGRDRLQLRAAKPQTGRQCPVWVARVETAPAVIAEMLLRAERGLAECRAGLALDGDKVLDRLFAP